MVQSFNVEIANQCGLNEAIALDVITNYILANKDIKVCYSEGRFWCMLAYYHLKIDLPYMSTNTIKRAVKHLESEGFLRIEHFSNLSRINCYSITEKAENILNVSTRWEKYE